jgi:large subunit ribosomal protein L15
MSNELTNLAPRPGSRRSPMRVGRGEGSGKGKTCGRGTKGDKARSGRKFRAYFEGGQMPLHRRLPKRGFHNLFANDFETVNVEQLSVLPAGSTVTAVSLHDAGIISRVGKDGVKLLGRGEISVALHVRLEKLSASAAEKVIAAGGTVEDSAGGGESSAAE